jgi:hypothetical protein
MAPTACVTTHEGLGASLRAACFGPKLHTCREPLRVTERSDAPQNFLPSLRGAQRRGNPALLSSSDTPPGKEQGFHRPAAGEALFTAEKDPKRLAPGARRLGSCLVGPLRFLAAAGRRRTHTSMCSNSGAFPLRLPAMLAALYGALSHSARASMRYMPAFPFHPTAATHCRCCKPDRACKWPVPVWLTLHSNHEPLRFMERSEATWQSRNVRKNKTLGCFVTLAMTAGRLFRVSLVKRCLRPPRPVPCAGHCAARRALVQSPDPLRPT